MTPRYATPATLTPEARAIIRRIAGLPPRSWQYEDAISAIRAVSPGPDRLRIREGFEIYLDAEAALMRSTRKARKGDYIEFTPPLSFGTAHDAEAEARVLKLLTVEGDPRLWPYPYGDAPDHLRIYVKRARDLPTPRWNTEGRRWTRVCKKRFPIVGTERKPIIGAKRKPIIGTMRKSACRRKPL